MKKRKTEKCDDETAFIGGSYKPLIGRHIGHLYKDEGKIEKHEKTVIHVPAI